MKITNEQIVQVVYGFIEKNGYGPTIREIGEIVGLASSSSVHARIQQLIGDGLLMKSPKRPRTLIPTKFYTLETSQIVKEWPGLRVIVNNTIPSGYYCVIGRTVKDFSVSQLSQCLYAHVIYIRQCKVEKQLKMTVKPYSVLDVYWNIVMDINNETESALIELCQWAAEFNK